jgi:rubrerythrin
MDNMLSPQSNDQNLKSRNHRTPLIRPPLLPWPLSSLHFRLQALEEEHQWLLKQIGRKRNELKKFLDQMRSLATEIFQRGQPLYQKLSDLDSEIHALFDEILTARKLGQQTKKAFSEFTRHFS